MPVVDKDLAIRCRREFIRRQGLDPTYIEVSAIQGVVTLRGELRPIRGQNVDLQHELEIIMQNIRRIPGVRDVRSEVGIRYGVGRPAAPTQRASAIDEESLPVPEDFD